MPSKQSTSVKAGLKVKAKIKTPQKESQVVKKETLAGIQVMRGRVVAAKQPKVVTVLVERKKTHPLYKKSFIRSKKYLVHDDLGVAAGDVVEIVKIKPVSKNKHFGVFRVVGKDMAAIISQQLQEKAAAEIAEVMPVEEEKEMSIASHQTKEEIDAKPEKLSKRKDKSGS